MNRTDKILLTLYISTLVAAGLVWLIFEVLSPESFGVLFNEEDRTWRTVMENICIIAGIVGVFASMKLMAIPRVQEKVKEESKYLKYSLLRYFLLAVPLCLSELTYYLFSSTNVVPFVGIFLIAFIFVWPSSSRRMREMGIEENEKTE